MSRSPESVERRITAQLIAAINLVIAAEAYAQQVLGRTIQFSTEDIRALAISAFIEQGRGH